MIVFRGDCSRYMQVCVLRKKSGASRALEQFLCDTRTNGKVAVIRSDGGLESQGPFQDLCLEH